MKHLRMSWATRADWFSSDGREQRIQDYVILANRLAWKRQGSFFAAAMLAAVYFDPVSILTYYAVVVLTEFLDALHARQSQAWDGQDPVVGRQILKRIVLNTALSAIAIVAFVVNIAVQETSAGHFMPLFFLFSASIFAAMYNSQIIGILLLRLAIYSCAFLYIALLDVLRYLPPLSSPIWMEFFTILFVIYFIGDISLKFYLSYQQSLKQMRRIKEDNARIKDALEVKSQFLATVSHELRTPLTSIMGSLELIKSEKMGVLPAGRKPVFGIAARNSQRLSTLVEDLLDLQKIEAGEMDFDFEAIDVNDLVTEAVDSISGYASKLGIEVAVASSVKNSQITGDRNRLIQVMNNLLSNALKFSEEGAAVQVSMEKIETRIRISVHDEGVGIPENARERVFGKFSQVDSSDIRKVGGTGLGLSITKLIVDEHNGSIDYNSERGVGSTFYVEFDELKDPDDQETTSAPLSTVARGGRCHPAEV